MAASLQSMYKKTALSIFFIAGIATANYAQLNLVQYAKPIIGTEKMGHTFPGATVPFGAVQLSPDTDTIPYETNNKYNPDPNRTVYYGNQNWEEMMQPWFAIIMDKKIDPTKVLKRASPAVNGA